MVATDRISAFDVVLPCGIPDKGRVLTQLSAFWFLNTARIVPNHLVEVIHDAGRLDAYLPAGRRFGHPKYLEGRSIVVKKTKRIPVECVVRGYLSGSAWEEYKNYYTVSVVPMPAGLCESQMLPEIIFTPSTKAESGHDLPMSMADVEQLVGLNLAAEIKDKSISVYQAGRDYAREKGFIIADTKFEFGLDGDKLILIDEAFTPDSSRFWDTATYKICQPQDSFDKQPVRDWLARSGWNKEPPAPMLPPDVIEQTAQRYRLALERLTGNRLI
jgi:phosphoribosylaminoimidazole-succinocarboxamide synthase